MKYNNQNSVIAFTEAKKYISGGVNSPVRAFKSIGGQPVFIRKGRGANIWDLDENRYIDYCLSWGSLILGHANKEVISQVKQVIQEGTSFGCPTLAETQLAKLICNTIPSIEKIRFVNSGTEAVMSAIRLARAYTGRNNILKFDGCYHGHSDSLLVAVGSGLGHSQGSSSAGVMPDVVKHTLSLPFNNLVTLRDYISKEGNKLAAIILEIVPANMGLILPDADFLQGIMELSEHYKCLIIADEVITGFRFPEGSAQQHYKFTPHLTTLGKIIGGGFPVGAYGGKSEIIDRVAPSGDVYQAGTLSGNPVAMNAGIATLSILSQPTAVRILSENSKYLSNNLKMIADRHRIIIHQAGSMFTLFLTGNRVRNFEDVKKFVDEKRFAVFYNRLLHQQIYMSPSLFETNFLSTAHTQKDIEITCDAIENALK